MSNSSDYKHFAAKLYEKHYPQKPTDTEFKLLKGNKDGRKKNVRKNDNRQ